MNDFYVFAVILQLLHFKTRNRTKMGLFISYNILSTTTHSTTGSTVPPVFLYLNTSSTSVCFTYPPFMLWTLLFGGYKSNLGRFDYPPQFF